MTVSAPVVSIARMGSQIWVGLVGNRRRTHERPTSLNTIANTIIMRLARNGGCSGIRIVTAAFIVSDVASALLIAHQVRMTLALSARSI